MKDNQDYVREQGSTTASDETPPRELGVIDELDPAEVADEDQPDPVEELAKRELGTETPHEIRGDGSIAYFGDAEREKADANIPPRERGTQTGGQQ